MITYRHVFIKRKPYRYGLEFPKHTEKHVHMTSLAHLSEGEKSLHPFRGLKNSSFKNHRSLKITGRELCNVPF